MATITDVAQRAGVSVSLVSRILRDDSAVRATSATRQRVQQAALDLHYRPNHAARALRLSKAGAVGLIVPDVTNAVFAELLRGVEAGADSAGLQVLLGRSERLKSGNDFLSRLLGEGRVDGFIVQPLDNADVKHDRDLIDPTVPQVLVNAQGRRPGSVVLEDDLAARIAVEHLVALDHCAIAFIGGPPHSYTSRRREFGYRTALKDAGLPVRSALATHRGYTPEDGRLSLHHLFETATKPTPSALLAANVNAAMGILLAARERELSVPDDISVVAIHDAWVAEFSNPPLTTVRMPLFELGYAAFQSLTGRMAGGKGHDTIVSRPAPVLIQRSSTAERRSSR